MQSTFSSCIRSQLTLYRRRAPFTCDAWSSSELQSFVSQVAGIDLVQAFDYEIANINISINDPSSREKVTAAEGDEEVSAFAWHYDSFPFVCVTMISDCSDMVGGETAIKTPCGDIKKVRGPAMVSLQSEAFSRQEIN